MTIIAYKDGVLAADSEMYWGELRCDYPDKLAIIEGAIIGCSGDIIACRKFVEWFREKGKTPDFEKLKFDAIVAYKDGRVESWDQRLYPLPITDEFAAMGSGMDFAIGAMAHGATARKAAEIAVRFCKSCGGKILTKSLDDINVVAE